MKKTDDLISRQAAIDALDALCDRECEYSKQQRSVMCGACRLGSAFDVIDELPSAHPEIIRCKDCKYFDPLNENVDYNFCDAWAGGTNEDMFCGFAERRQDASSR